MTHTRREFPESVKRQALERAGWRCQDPLCGKSEEWNALMVVLNGAEIAFSAETMTRQLLELVREIILGKRFIYRRLLNPIIRKFKLDGGALLEIDHEREDADGGEPVLGNAIVRCVFCHFFKTQARANSRRRAPKKAPPENTSILTMSVVEGLRAKIAEVKPTDARFQQPNFWPPPGYAKPTVRELLPAERKARRHFTPEQSLAAAQRRELAILNNEEGC